MTAEQRQTPDLVAMYARIEDLARKDSLSAKELKEFVFLIYDKKQYDEGIIAVDYKKRMHLPSRETPKIIMSISDPSTLRGVYITVVDEVNAGKRNRPSGELVTLTEAVGIEWYVGVRESVPSDLLGRRIALDTSNLRLGMLWAQEPLTNQECAKVAKTIYQPYLDSLNQPSQPAV